MPKGQSSLTGGSGDVNPQWFKLPLLVFGTQTPLTGTVPLSIQVPNPVSRLKQQGNKATVLEILKVRWNRDIIAAINDSAGQFVFLGYLMTNNAPNPAANQGRVIDYMDDTTIIYNPATHSLPGSDGVGPTVNPLTMSPSDNGRTNWPIEHDLTDGAGHGVLVATDQITLAGTAQVTDLSVGLDAGAAGFYTVVPLQGAASLYCEFLYRFKEVALQEYIGIVQSQQSST